MSTSCSCETQVARVNLNDWDIFDTLTLQISGCMMGKVTYLGKKSQIIQENNTSKDTVRCT